MYKLQSMFRKVFRLFTGVLSLVALFACEKPSEIYERTTLKVETTCPQLGLQADTKTYINSGQVKWVANDQIHVFAEDGFSALSDKCGSASSTFSFTVNAWDARKNPKYAVYCGQKWEYAPKVSGGTITAEQVAFQPITHKGSFCKTGNLSIGEVKPVYDSKYSVKMMNVCGLLRFSFAKYDDIMSVEFEDKDGKPLAGIVKLGFNDNGEPVVEQVVTPSSKVKVTSAGKTSPLGNTDKAELPKGVDYYACVLPGTYTLNVTIARYDGSVLRLEGNSSVAVERNKVVDLLDIDEAARLVGNSSVGNESYNEYDSQAGLPMHIDFSRVGYHWGESELPVVPVVTTLTAPADGSDMTEAIQKALDNTTGGAVLLKAGTYNVEGKLYINHSNVVLRGEGENTVIFAKGKSNDNEERSLLTVGNAVSRQYTSPSEIIENAPVGQMWVRVADPSGFKVADDVALYRPGTAEWISDIRMDQIPQNADNSVKQWKPSTYDLYSDRKVVRVSADTIFFDNPVVMSLNDVYGEASRGRVYKVSCSRIRECGVENLKMVSEFDPSKMDELGNHIDEDHCWSAICIKAVEHSWVRNVSVTYFGYAGVNIIPGARYVTVADCVSRHPVSVLTGSRRYAFHISGGELCMVKNCLAEEDRHGFVTGAKVSGPNVFLSCEMVNAFSDAGPHQRWAMGALYDNVKTDYRLNVQDGCNNGTGHGWRGVNFILWNCQAATIVCQSPWATGLNWCVGCIGEKNPGRRKDRPDGEWISHGTPVSPSSLYEWQMQQRKEKGISLSNILL